MICSHAIQNAGKHDIKVENLHDGQTISYSLVICRGRVENPKNSKCAPEAPPKIVVMHNKTARRTHLVSKTGSFKFFLDLDVGLNVVAVAFCCATKSVALEFKPHSSALSVLPLYIICQGHDGRFQAPKSEENTAESACRRITTGCKLLQAVFAEKLHESGLGRKTFSLEPPGCIPFYSQLHVEEAYKMAQLELWCYFAREIMRSHVGSVDKKYLAFLSCTKYNGDMYTKDIKDYSEILGLTNGYVAIGGDGLALLGTACLYTWPQSVSEIKDRFENNSAVDPTKFMDDSCYRGTLGGCFSTTLGATLHELCHTFDLGHCEEGIMARGFDNIQNVFLPNEHDCDITNHRNINLNLSKLVLIKNHQKDDTYWTDNCLLLLYYHKWFNVTKYKRKGTIHYNSFNKIVKSTSGLRVVEVRRKRDEMVLRHWVFKDKVLKYFHQIGEDMSESEERIVVVEDNDGNIVKRAF